MELKKYPLGLLPDTARGRETMEIHAERLLQEKLMAQDKPGIPESWKNVPSIGSKQPGQEQQQAGGPPSPFQFMGVEYPPEFVENMLTLVSVPGHGDFYTNAPVALEHGLVGLVQAFALSDDKKNVIQYRLLTFVQLPGIVSYLVKPPVWWEQVLGKQTQLPE